MNVLVVILFRKDCIEIRLPKKQIHEEIIATTTLRVHARVTIQQQLLLPPTFVSSSWHSDNHFVCPSGQSV